MFCTRPGVCPRPNVSGPKQNPEMLGLSTAPSALAEPGQLHELQIVCPSNTLPAHKPQAKVGDNKKCTSTCGLPLQKRARQNRHDAGGRALRTGYSPQSSSNAGRSVQDCLYEHPEPLRAAVRAQSVCQRCPCKYLTIQEENQCLQ